MKNPKLKLGVLYSSGKDSNYATYLMQQEGHSIDCLITVKSNNQDSYMFHTPNIDFSRMQSEAMDIALIEEISKGEEEVEIEDLKSAVKKAQERYLIDGVVTGALYSSYQKDRIERICNELGLEVFSPLWHIDQESEMRRLLELGFEFIFSSVAAYGLNKDWLGKIITDKQIDKLVRLNEKVGLNIAGEGGEFESFVIDSPMYNKRIEIKDYEIVERDEYTAHLIIKDAEFVEK